MRKRQYLPIYRETWPKWFADKQLSLYNPNKKIYEQKIQDEDTRRRDISLSQRRHREPGFRNKDEIERTPGLPYKSSQDVIHHTQRPHIQH